MTRTLAAIAAYNEEVAIGSVVLQAKDYVDEVLVVDDGSEDRTAQVARRANAVVLRHPTNEGKGIAIRTALDHARSKGFDATVLLDGDGQHDPADIPDLLEPIISGKADIVLGFRDRSISDIPMYRRFGMRVLDFLTAFGSMDSVRDSQCGFRALSRTAVEMLNLEEKSFGVESEMLIQAKARNLRVVEVPIGVRYDVDGSTKGPLFHGMGVVDRILRIVAVHHPLLFFGVPGGTMFLLGLWFGARTIELYNVERAFYIGPALLSIILVLLGVLSIFTGVILNVMPKAIVRFEQERRNHSRNGGQV